MTTVELYEIVMHDPEVWRPGITLRGMYWSHRGTILDPDAAELMLEALYARATGCGVYETQSDLPEMRFATKRQHHASQHGPTRLAALRAAYRAGKENKK